MVAARAAEVGDVLLVDAGPLHDPLHPPLDIAGPSFHGAAALPGRRWTTGYGSGRGLGGSTAINAMVLSGDDDLWRDLPLEARPARPDERGPLADALLHAGVGAVPLSLARDDAGRRWSVVEAYIAPAMQGGRLGLVGDTHVSRVVVERGVARGVELADGRVLRAGAVVLAAGATRTPVLLLRSGLRRPGIGRGLQDHPSITLPLRLHAAPAGDPATVSVTVGLWRSVRRPDDLQVLAVDAVDPSDPAAAMLVASVMQPSSRHEVRLPADDLPTAEGIIDPPLDGPPPHPDDRAALGAAAEVVHDLLAASAVAEVVAAAGDIVIGGAWHAAGTCRMGRADDDRAVVDAAGRVFGTERLWVADASIFPRVPSVNPMVAVIRVAERVAADVAAALAAAR